VGVGIVAQVAPLIFIKDLLLILCNQYTPQFTEVHKGQTIVSE